MTNKLSADHIGSLALVGVGDYGDIFGFSEAVMVSGASNVEMNGTYRREGFNDFVFKYVKDSSPVEYPGGQFIIYRCQLSNNDRRWYMSFVKTGSSPGTTQDVDFYSAPNQPQTLNYNPHDPPSEGWLRLPTRQHCLPTLGANPGAGHGTLRVVPSFFNLVNSPPDTDRLPITRYTTGEDECPVCHDRFKLDEFYVRLGCCHVLHRGCLDHLRVQAIHDCPLCRRCMYE